MSRFDQPTNEPDLDRYETRDDIDVPDFDQSDPPVGVVEHSAQNALSSLHELEVIVLGLTDLNRAVFLKRLTKQLWTVADRLDHAASMKVEALVERRR